MRKIIEQTHVFLGGEIGSINDWVFPYLDEEHKPTPCGNYRKRTISGREYEISEPISSRG